MDMFMASLEAIGVLIGLGAVGFYVVARKIIPPDILKLLSSLAIEVALPLFVFSNLTEKLNLSTSAGWWKMPLLFPVFAAITFVFTLALSRMFNKDIRTEASVAMFLHNPTFVPLSIIIGVFGSDSPHILNLFLFTTYSAAFYFNFYRFFFRKKALDAKDSDPSGSGSGKTGLDMKKILNPVLKATVLALIIKFTGLDKYVPDLVLSVTKNIGAMSFPLVMMILGGYIYMDIKKSGKLYIWSIVKFVAAKNLIFPLGMLALIYLIRPEFPIALILLLESASPPLSSVPILVQREGGRPEIANQFLVSSFFLAIFTIPLMLTLLYQMY